MCSVGSVVDLSQAEGGAELASGGSRDVYISLFLGAVVVQHNHDRVVAHDRMLVLQVVG